MVCVPYRGQFQSIKSIDVTSLYTELGRDAQKHTIINISMKTNIVDIYNLKNMGNCKISDVLSVFHLYC